MNEAHFHLVVNHLPIIFPLVATMVLITGFISKSEAVKRIALMIFVLGALTTIAAMASGEGTEDVVEHIAGIEHKTIHEHEEAAETFALLSYILGGLSLVGLWASFKQRPMSKWTHLSVAIFAVIVLFFAKKTGTTGGEIRHTEIRQGYNTTAPE